MTRPATIRLGDVYCNNGCCQDSTGDDIQAEQVVDSDDEQAWNVECPNCGATGSIVDEKGFNPNTEVEEPFRIGL